MTKFILFFMAAIISIFTDVSVSIGNTLNTWSITVDARQTVSTYNPLISGSNLNWINNGDGIYDPSRGQVRTDAVKLLQDMGLAMLRFPGGSLSEFYDWKSGIGAPSSRRTGLDYGKNKQKMNFGIDDFLKFCEASNITPFFTIGYSNNTPTTASEIVEYCNGSLSTPFGSLRAKNGHPAPYGVKYWEIGNEIYAGGITVVKATEYGKKVHDIAVKMKKIDPTIKIGAIGLGLGNIWDENVLKECANDIDFMVHHRYFPNTWSDDADATNSAVAAASVKFINEVKQLQYNAAKYNPKLKVAVTEYNLHFRDGKGNFINKTSDVQQALFIAECMRLFQLNNVLFATKWDLAHSHKHYFSDINFNGGAEVTLSPTYYAQQIFTKANFETILDTKTFSPTTSVKSFGEIKNFDNVPLLTSLAGKDRSGKILSVIVINRDLRSSYTVKMDIKNFTAIKKIDMTSMKAPSSGPSDRFIIENSLVLPNTLKSLVIPPNSISLYKISN